MPARAPRSSDARRHRRRTPRREILREPQTAAIGSLAGLPIDDPQSLVDVTVDLPAPRPHDLLVRVEAVSVNPADVKVRAGLPAQSSPRVLGFDAAGTVVAAGPQAAGFAVGDAVWYAGDITRPGSNAEYQYVDSRIVSAKPESLSWAEAAAVPLTALTAWETLFERFRLTAGSTGTLLVLGGAGGVGSAAIQLARLRTNVRVLASASRPESADWVRDLGAHCVLDHRDLVASAAERAPEGIDYVLTPHSAGNVEAFAEIMNPFGAITATDDPVGLDIKPLKAKSIAWHWEFMFTRSMFQTPDIAEQGRILSQVAELVDTGDYRTTATTVLEDFTAENLREAQRLVESGRTVGKVVVTR